MKQIIAKLYIIIIVLLILLGLGYFSVEVIRSRDEYKRESISVAEEIKLLIEKNWYKNKNFSNQSLNDQLEDMMNSTKDLNSIVIYSADEGLKVISSRYSDRSFLLNSFNPDDPNWNKEPEYSFKSWDKIDNFIVRTPLQLTERGYAFDIVYNVLPKDKIQDLLQYALKIIAVLLILTVIVIILFGLWKSKYTVKEYDDELFKPMGSPGEDLSEQQVVEDTDHITDSDESLDSFDELDDFDVGIESETEESDELLDDLDDFGLETDESDSFNEDIDEFSIATEESTEEPEELDDFSLDFEEQDVTADELPPEDEPDDFSLDFDEEPESLVDAHADAEEDLEDFDVETGEMVDELEDFDLDIEEETIEEPEDFSLEIDEEISTTEEELTDDETLDELEDFDLDTEEETSADETLDELEDFDLDTEEETSADETLDELEDFDLDTEEETSSDQTLDELEDFDLDTEEETSADETFDELEDFDLDTEETELPLDAEDFELIDDIDDMDLSPEVIEASTDINDLPSMEIEEEIVTPRSDFKNVDEIAPEISSLLEKAGVSDKDLSVAVLNLQGLDLSSHYDFIRNHFEGNANIFELKSNQIAIALADLDSNAAINEITSLINEAKSRELVITAGISSMNGRRVGENRLMGEAVKAVSKAEELSKELLAFKPDPQKYNDFIINS